MLVQQGAKYLWQLPEIDQEKLYAIAAQYNLSLPIAQTLLSRGYASEHELNEYLFSSFDKDVTDAALLKDAQKTVDRILLAIEKKEKILIFGDYDVDGITSSALMLMCLLPLGAQVNYFVPHRVKDGYGLSITAVQKAADSNYKVIITVDNGITAFKPVERANTLGIDVIITDHHRPHGALPDAFAIVNPNQDDCSYPFKTFAGVGVAFKILSLLYAQRGKDLPAKAYELLLLGTIADVVPLNGENRFWVRHGLQQINRQQSYSFQVLRKNGALVKPAITSTDIGFTIAPQINALGRLEDPRHGVKFLIGTDPREIERVGKVLSELNTVRKSIERSIYQEIVDQITSGSIDLSTENIIIAASPHWPPGVIGLVASRLVSAYGKPTLLFHITQAGVAKGSCRSISAFSIFDALQESQELITSFGGHSQAAGLALPLANVPELKQKLEALVMAQLTPEDLQQKIKIDASLELSDVNKKITTDMQLLEPFGHQNAQPYFLLKNISLVEGPSLLKDVHVKCRIVADGIVKPLIFFNRPELFEVLRRFEQNSFSAVVQINQNYWNNKLSIELIGLDVEGVAG